MHALSSLFLVVLTLTTISAQCSPQATITNSTADRNATLVGQITRSLFINHTLAEQPHSGLVKDGILSIVNKTNNNVACQDIVLLGLRGELGDGITWGTIADFVINAPQSSIQSISDAYNSSLSLPLPNGMTNVMRQKFPAKGASVTAIPTSALVNFLINAQLAKVRSDNGNLNIVVGGANQNSTGVAAQPCVVSGWSECDGCKRDKQQIVTRTITRPAVGRGSCPPTQMSVHCDRKCLTDWQIGLIALACFLFLVCVCICLYCVCVRRRPTPGEQRAQQKEKELATPPPAVDEKIDVDVVDPVRPSTGGLDEPANFHRASSETGTGPRPTATFHDDDEPAETKPTPVQEEAKSSEPEPVPVASPPAGAPRANVVRVHL